MVMVKDAKDFIHRLGLPAQISYEWVAWMGNTTSTATLLRVVMRGPRGLSRAY
jgi:hypothetical protein